MSLHLLSHFMHLKMPSPRQSPIHNKGFRPRKSLQAEKALSAFCFRSSAFMKLSKQEIRSQKLKRLKLKRYLKRTSKTAKGNHVNGAAHNAPDNADHNAIPPFGAGDDAAGAGGQNPADAGADAGIPPIAAGQNVPPPVGAGQNVPPPVAAGQNVPPIGPGAGQNVPPPVGAGQNVPPPIAAGQNVPPIGPGAGQNAPPPVGAGQYVPPPIAAGQNVPPPVGPGAQGNFPPIGPAAAVQYPQVNIPPPQNQANAPDRGWYNYPQHYAYNNQPTLKTLTSYNTTDEFDAIPIDLVPLPRWIPETTIKSLLVANCTEKWMSTAIYSWLSQLINKQIYHATLPTGENSYKDLVPMPNNAGLVAKQLMTQIANQVKFILDAANDESEISNLPAWSLRPNASKHISAFNKTFDAICLDQMTFQQAGNIFGLVLQRVPITEVLVNTLNTLSKSWCAANQITTTRLITTADFDNNTQISKTFSSSLKDVNQDAATMDNILLSTIAAGKEYVLRSTTANPRMDPRLTLIASAPSMAQEAIVIAARVIRDEKAWARKQKDAVPWAPQDSNDWKKGAGKWQSHADWNTGNDWNRDSKRRKTDTRGGNDWNADTRTRNDWNADSSNDTSRKKREPGLVLTPAGLRLYETSTAVCAYIYCKYLKKTKQQTRSVLMAEIVEEAKKLEGCEKFERADVYRSLLDFKKLLHREVSGKYRIIDFGKEEKKE